MDEWTDESGSAGAYGARTLREDVEITVRAKRGREEGRETDWKEREKREQNAWEI